MLTTIKRLSLAAFGALGLVAAVARLRQKRKASPDALKLLRYLATHASAPVPELSSHLKASAEDTLRLLTELEGRGFAQLSGDQGSGHVRIAAITKAGREHVA
jgi:DNA-binding MarR family transcriptional regulator